MVKNPKIQSFDLKFNRVLAVVEVPVHELLC